MTLDRAGVIFKKCDATLHKPDTNKACAADTCQHTCPVPDKCPHAWTLRYWAAGTQRERSFKDTVTTSGRVNYGSGRKLADDARLKMATDKREQGRTFIDHSKSGRENFNDACQTWISHKAVGESTKEGYTTVLSAWVGPAFEGRTIAQVATDRDGVLDLLKRMAHLSYSRRAIARQLVAGTLDAAVKAGKLAGHKCGDIEVFNDGSKNGHDDFVFPAHAQIRQVADAAGICVWIMRGCGARIMEALGVEKSDFIDGGKTLRLNGQASRDGTRKVPLKHRKKGEYRDVPVPTWLWDKVKDLPDGPLCPGVSTTYAKYNTTLTTIQTAAKRAGIPEGFRPHSLRHAFASVLLSRLVPITDLAVWLGHRDINETYKTYGHLVPSAAGRAASVLDAEYAEWSTTKAA
jgi:integrase